MTCESLPYQTALEHSPQWKMEGREFNSEDFVTETMCNRIITYAHQAFARSLSNLRISVGRPLYKYAQNAPGTNITPKNAFPHVCASHREPLSQSPVHVSNPSPGRRSTLLSPAHWHPRSSHVHTPIDPPTRRERYIDSPTIPFRVLVFIIGIAQPREVIRQT